MTQSGELTAFLRAILPEAGRKCATTIIEGRARNRFFDTIEQLAAHILAEDARLEGTTGAVYHACAGYDDSGKRTQAAVVALKSLWLDVDCGDGKAYPDVAGGLAALRSFLQASGL